MKIRNNTKSILEEIFETSSDMGITVIEAKAEHAFASMFNFLKLIDTLDMTDEETDELTKKILISIKHRDKTRFDKCVRKMKRSKGKKNET